MLLVIVGFTRDSCSSRACTRSYLRSVLICDLHEKIELSPPPSIPPAKEETRKRVVAVNAWIRCHTLPLCGENLGSLTFFAGWRRTKRPEQADIKAETRASRIPRELKSWVPTNRIATERDCPCSLLLPAEYRRHLDKLRTKYRVTVLHPYERSSSCTHEAQFANATHVPKNTKMPDF